MWTYICVVDNCLFPVFYLLLVMCVVMLCVMLYVTLLCCVSDWNQSCVVVICLFRIGFLRFCLFNISVCLVFVVLFVIMLFRVVHIYSCFSLFFNGCVSFRVLWYLLYICLIYLNYVLCNYVWCCKCFGVML